MRKLMVMMVVRSGGGGGDGEEEDRGVRRVEWPSWSPASLGLDRHAGWLAAGFRSDLRRRHGFSYFFVVNTRVKGYRLNAMKT